MGLPTNGCGNDGSGVVGCGDIRPLPLEYRRLLYHDLSDTGDMSDGGATDRRASDTAVVGAG